MTLEAASASRAAPWGGLAEASRGPEIHCITDEREVGLMRAIVIRLIVLAVIAAISLFGFFGVVTPIATTTIWFVPATFTVSLVIGFASRRRSWFG